MGTVAKNKKSLSQQINWSMINIQIISGTDRPNSNALRIAGYLKEQYSSSNTEVGIINLQKFPAAEVVGGPYGEEIPKLEKFVEPLLAADGLVFVCPEYNGGYPGILKLFIDYLPFPESLNKKPVCFIGEANGAFGGLRAVEQLQQVAGYRNAHVFPERVFISRVHKNFDEKQGIRDSFQQGLLESQIENFAPFVRGLTSSEEE
jgi:NAD(P)H-dependent FMN reductase